MGYNHYDNRAGVALLNTLKLIIEQSDCGEVGRPAPNRGEVGRPARTEEPAPNRRTEGMMLISLIAEGIAFLPVALVHGSVTTDQEVDFGIRNRPPILAGKFVYNNLAALNRVLYEPILFFCEMILFKTGGIYMSVQLSQLLPAVMIVLCFGSYTNAVTVQSPDDVLPDGTAYLWVEAEDVFEIDGADPDLAWVIVDKDNPIKSIETFGDPPVEVVKGGLDILPADTNASGGAALLDQVGSGGTAKWQVQFEIPATYYLFMHYSFFNRDDNTSYGNEDSIYVPPSFNANSRSDWIGFEGVDSTLLDPKTGDSDRDGWMPLGKDIVSAGEVESHNSTDEDFWDGQFHWAWMDVAVDMDANNAYVGDFGHGILYEITEADVGTVLDFEISTRETYGVIDGLLFATSNELLDVTYTQEEFDEFFLNLGGALPCDIDGDGVCSAADIDAFTANPIDLNGDGAVDGADRAFLIEDSAYFNTWSGDANLDGEFSSGDLVDVLAAGTYENDLAAGWATGDFNGSGRFDSSDLVEALAGGGYEQGVRPSIAAVPEPSSLFAFAVGVIVTAPWRRPHLRRLHRHHSCRRLL